MGGSRWHILIHINKTMAVMPSHSELANYKIIEALISCLSLGNL